MIKKYEPMPEYQDNDATFDTVSFFVNHSHSYWYRERLDEVLELIEALRVKNGFTEYDKNGIFF